MLDFWEKAKDPKNHFVRTYLSKTKQEWKENHPIWKEFDRLAPKLATLSFIPEDFNALRACWPSEPLTLDPITRSTWRWHATSD